jgi:ABC-type transport system substrate-binding protein
MKRLLPLLLLALMVVTAFAQPVMAQDDAQTVTMAFVEGSPGTLDPQVADTINDFLVLRNIYEGLVSYDPATLQPTPGLAESWDISEDGLTYTFHLRQGVKFHNGRALTAADVKYSLERLANPATGKSYTTFLLDSVKGIAAVRSGEADAVEGLEVVDDYTFKISLMQPVASFLNQLTLPGAFVVAEEAAAKDNFAKNPVGTGPYKFVQWVENQQITLESNPDYWGTQPDIKFVVLRVIPDTFQQINEFKAGKIDIMLVPPFELKQLSEDAALAGQFQEIPALAVTYLIVNLNDEALSKLEVRQALNMGFDRELLLTGILKGQGQSAYGVIPPLLEAYDSEVPYTYDPIKAKALLEQAGYADGLELDVNLATDETEKRIMGVIQAQWAEIGVSLTINSMDKATYDEARVQCQGTLFVSAWTGDYADPDGFSPLLIDSSATRTACGYGMYSGVDEVKALLAKAASMPRGPERDAAYRDAQSIAMDQAISIPIYFRSRTALINSRLKATYIDATLSVKFANIEID